VYFTVHITERNSSVLIKVITAKYTSAKICQEIIINFIPLLGFDGQDSSNKFVRLRTVQEIKANIEPILWLSNYLRNLGGGV
jgi:hypothetical protein